MILHERDEWLAGYQVAPNEGAAWWGGFTFPDPGAITNITWHYPGGDVPLTAAGQYAAELRNEQAAYHRRSDGGTTGRPAPFAHGYDLGYNAMIDPLGGVWKVRWTEKRCAANGTGPANAVSFAVQLMLPTLGADITPAQLTAARALDAELRLLFLSIPPGVAGHRCHSDWFATACPGAVIAPRVRAGDLLWRPEPPEDDEMQIRFRHTAYQNVFVLPDGTPVGPGANAAFGALDIVTEAHDPTLAACCHASWGLGVGDAVASGLLVPA